MPGRDQVNHGSRQFELDTVRVFSRGRSGRPAGYGPRVHQQVAADHGDAAEENLERLGRARIAGRRRLHRDLEAEQPGCRTGGCAPGWSLQPRQWSAYSLFQRSASQAIGPRASHPVPRRRHPVARAPTGQPTTRGKSGCSPRPHVVHIYAELGEALNGAYSSEFTPAPVRVSAQRSGSLRARPLHHRLADATH